MHPTATELFAETIEKTGRWIDDLMTELGVSAAVKWDRCAINCPPKFASYGRCAPDTGLRLDQICTPMHRT